MNFEGALTFRYYKIENIMLTEKKIWMRKLGAIVTLKLPF